MSHAITNQPGAPPGGASWMSPPPDGGPGIPDGLEYLSVLDQVLAHQIVELLEAFTGWETNNKYALKNSMGQQVFYAFEKTDTCMRICCKQHREFTIHIVDNNQKEVMRVYRPFKCCSGCCWCAGACDCCADELCVEAPPGQVVGIVKQSGGACSLNYQIQDAAGNDQLMIEGPCCCMMCLKCCTDIDFPIFPVGSSNQIGSVTKQWSGLAKEVFTTANNFAVTFPMDLDVKMKATLLGAMFLIDFMAFEQDDNN